VINEAASLGLPVIVSEQVGARDLLVQNLINGFVVNSDNPAGIARALGCLAQDRPGWDEMSAASVRLAQNADVDVFARAVESLSGLA
jgi:glycosyltransferase involved in cell wall biosynthesis